MSVVLVSLTIGVLVSLAIGVLVSLAIGVSVSLTTGGVTGNLLLMLKDLVVGDLMVATRALVVVEEDLMVSTRALVVVEEDLMVSTGDLVVTNDLLMLPVALVPMVTGNMPSDVLQSNGNRS